MRWVLLRTQQSRVTASTTSGRKGAQAFWPAPSRPALGRWCALELAKHAGSPGTWRVVGCPGDIAAPAAARHRAGVYTKMTHASPAEPGSSSATCPQLLRHVRPADSPGLPCFAPGPLRWARRGGRGTVRTSSCPSSASHHLSRAHLHVLFVLITGNCSQCCYRVTDHQLRCEGSPLRFAGAHGVLLEGCSANQRLRQ